MWKTLIYFVMSVCPSQITLPSMVHQKYVLSSFFLDQFGLFRGPFYTWTFVIESQVSLKCVRPEGYSKSITIREFHSLNYQGHFISDLNELYYVMRFQILTAMNMKVAVIWNDAPFSLIDIDQRFRAAYCLHHQVASETSVSIHQTTRRNIPDDSHLRTITFYSPLTHF
jgi:hypothetical protein